MTASKNAFNEVIRARSRHGTEVKASSSVGRAAVSKTAGRGFDSLLACHYGRNGSETG